MEEIINEGSRRSVRVSKAIVTIAEKLNFAIDGSRVNLNQVATPACMHVVNKHLSIFA